ncbi:hypothetical protein HERIO_887 [Hepatospora eriocheir]|uniref:Uncharacterized protein n=1 Tax=Hepatospora eriocheir TaxID=1081669 RepID=A0A1X0QC04_9MICR|nr:hypothetical protein HERIO_887 [Hepatospora eriocheir]
MDSEEENDKLNKINLQLDQAELTSKSKERVRKALLLRKSTSMFSIFDSADYIKSAMLFEELAEECKDDRISSATFYKEAAETFIKDNKEFSLWKASECYYKIYELFVKDMRDEASEFLQQSCMLLVKIKSFEIAGMRYIKIAELYEMDKVSLAVINYKRAIESYSKVTNYKSNIYLVKKRLLSCCIYHKDINRVIETLKEYNYDFKYSKLCYLLMVYLKGDYEMLKEEELDTEEESEVLEAILYKEPEDSIEIVKNFINENVFNDLSNSLFELFLENYQLSKIC